MKKCGITEIIDIAAGGYHNLLLSDGLGYVITYGGNDYGQLGHGTQWDDPYPKIISQLKEVYKISAGRRHSMIIKRGSDHYIPEVWGWGYNGYGELGLGDTNIR
jgi:alpha-tubulin suppressor-like RCC1 family protein